MIIINLDEFRNVNDTRGQRIGDEVLRRMAERIESELRGGDTLARVGGDEFAILLELHDEDSITLASTIAARVHGQIHNPLTIDAQSSPLVMTASIGIAIASACERRDAEIVIRDAEIAMHAARALGPGNTTTYEPTMHTVALERSELRNDLNHALARNELLLNYQPIIDLASGKVIAFEALLRWHHPERGWQNPGEFIPVAEITGLILPIGRWVIDQAVAELALWRRGAAISMSINLSPTQLTDNGIVEVIASALKRHGVQPAWVTIELTESGDVDDLGENVERLAAIRDLGVRVVADDFGAGRASYAALSKLPYTGIKIDMSIVRAGGRPGTRRPAVTDPVAVCHGPHAELDRRCRGHRNPRRERGSARAGLRSWPGLPLFKAGKRRGGSANARNGRSVGVSASVTPVTAMPRR